METLADLTCLRTLSLSSAGEVSAEAVQQPLWGQLSRLSELTRLDSLALKLSKEYDEAEKHELVRRLHSLGVHLVNLD